MKAKKKSSEYLPPALAALDRNLLPRHLAIIMDGNGRWAQARGKCRVVGHRKGAESVRAIVQVCRKLGIKALTLYAFSEENWARPQREVSALMTLLAHYLKAERQEMIKQGIRLNAIGNISRLPECILDQFKQTTSKTSGGQDMILTLALSYGGRQEIIQATRQLAQKVARGYFKSGDIDEATLQASLYTADLPDLDLLIRTSGEFRISNFLLWQMAYAELYFTETLWPDFREEELAQALMSYARRQRRFGLTEQQIKTNDVQ